MTAPGRATCCRLGNPMWICRNKFRHGVRAPARSLCRKLECRLRAYDQRPFPPIWNALHVELVSDVRRELNDVAPYSQINGTSRHGDAQLRLGPATHCYKPFRSQSIAIGGSHLLRKVGIQRVCIENGAAGAKRREIDGFPASVFRQGVGNARASDPRDCRCQLGSLRLGQLPPVQLCGGACSKSSMRELRKQVVGDKSPQRLHSIDFVMRRSGRIRCSARDSQHEK